MCGIVGYIGENNAEQILIDGLNRLEYRGYDSAGIATIFRNPNTNSHTTLVRRREGKVRALKDLLQKEPCLGTVGIGHVRWATHGKPNEQNAHPQQVLGITIVHNGMIENYRQLKMDLINKGKTFNSDTDTEIIAHLIADERNNGADLLEATRLTVAKLRGTYAIAVLDQDSPDTITCAKMSSPLLLGIDNEAMHLASDLPAILNHTNKCVFLDDGDIAEITKQNVHIINHEGAKKPVNIKTIEWSLTMAEKDGHRHFMHKEIYEQPQCIANAVKSSWNFTDNEPCFDYADISKLKDINRIVMIGHGSALIAGQIGAQFIERNARIQVNCEIASEFRCRDAIVDNKTLVIGVSQSGETLDTLLALKMAAEKGAKVLSICNVFHAAIPRLCAESVGTIYTKAGPEIGVASTKGLFTQLIALKLLSLSLAQQRQSISDSHIRAQIDALASLPGKVENCLKQESAIRSIAQHYMHAKSMLFLGSGIYHPIALEGALKMKELSYIHAEGYAAAEMKHGPIALVDSSLPICMLGLKGAGYEKSCANLEQARSRGGKIITICEENDERMRELSDHCMFLSPASEIDLPFLSLIPLQLFAYHVADLKGLDIDQPRNLAKSVTVE